MLNTICLMGRLTEDPKIYKGEESQLARFSLAVNTGDEASFFDCKVFGQEKVVDYLHKGDKIAITGRLLQEKFDRKDGTKGSAIVIVVNAIEFADVLTNNEESNALDVLPEEEEKPAKPTKPVAKQPTKPVANQRRTR